MFGLVVGTLFTVRSSQAQYRVWHSLSSPNSGEYGRFGGAVATVGDVGGNDVPDVIVGAAPEAVEGTDQAGRAYVVDGATGDVLHTLQSPNVEAGGLFGYAVASVGDVDNDGVPDILVGAMGETVDGQAIAGRVYQFSGADGEHIRTITSDTPKKRARFGGSLDGLPDVTGDGGERRGASEAGEEADAPAIDPPAVAVVDAETPGNVGTVARAMKNFGFEELLLVDPPPLPRDGEAYGFAGAAREDVLPGAREVRFSDLVSGYHTVGFTAVTNESGEKHVRYPFATPGELADELSGVVSDGAPVALVFGRERVGLTNEELARLDRVCSIPANPDYPTLNLGQAATIALYELRGLALGGGPEGSQHPDRGESLATPAEVEAFHEHFSGFLRTLGYREEKRAKTERLLRRLVGRANPTGRELRTLRGVFRRALQVGERREDEEWREE
jgi:TrmH family RNA methyltransferase